MSTMPSKAGKRQPAAAPWILYYGGPGAAPAPPDWGVGMTPGAASAWSPAPPAPARGHSESKSDPEADHRASYGAANHVSFAVAHVSQPPGGPPMPPPGGGGGHPEQHSGLSDPDYLPRTELPGDRHDGLRDPGHEGRLRRPHDHRLLVAIGTSKAAGTLEVDVRALLFWRYESAAGSAAPK